MSLYKYINYQPLLRELSEQTKHNLAMEDMEERYYYAGKKILPQARRSPFNMMHFEFNKRQTNAALLHTANTILRRTMTLSQIYDEPVCTEDHEHDYDCIVEPI
jgi:hypothetical protein